MEDRTLILINPAAGGGRGGRLLSPFESICHHRPLAAGGGIDVALTDPGGLVSQAREASHHYSRIIAVGGDGTASQIIRGIAESGGETAFGLLPLGTGNDLARMLGTFPPILPETKRGLAAALHSLMKGEVRRIDLLEMEGIAPFINYAGIGLDGAVLEGYLDFQKKNLYRSFRQVRGARFLFYALFLCRHLSYRLPPGLEIRVGRDERPILSGKTNPLKGVILNNIPYYAGGFVLHPDSDPTDGLFEITLIRGPLDIFRVLASRIHSFRRRSAGLRQIKTDRLTWSAPRGIPFQWDGERSPSPLPPSGTIKIAGQIPVLIPLDRK